MDTTSLRSVLNALVGRDDLTIFTQGGADLSGTLSLVGEDVAIISPDSSGNDSYVIPLRSIADIRVPNT